MNICILISSLGYGGSSQVAIDLACGLKDKGHRITVVSLWNQCSDKYLERLNSKGIEFKTCNKKSKFDFLCFERLRKILNDGGYDLINTHLTSLFYCFLAKPKQRVVHTIHSVPNLDIPRIYLFLMKNWLRKHNVTFVGCSQDITAKAHDYYKNQKIELITNGFGYQQNISIRQDKKIYDFIYVGRMVAMKNNSDLIKAFKLLNEDNKHSLCMIGDGKDRQKLEQFCSKETISNVHFAGAVNNVFDYLSKAKVFCLFSDYEGGPICLLEAMSCGLPVVCSDIGGNRTYVNNNENGFLFELHNIKEASDKMRLLIEDNNLYDKMSKNAIKVAKENSVENMVKKYESLFEEIING